MSTSNPAYGLRQSAFLQTIQDADTVRQKTDDAKTPAKTRHHDEATL
jgi:hypothetical protein